MKADAKKIKIIDKQLKKIAKAEKKLTDHKEDNIDADKLVIFINEESDFEGFHNKYKDTFEFIPK